MKRLSFAIVLFLTCSCRQPTVETSDKNAAPPSVIDVDAFKKHLQKLSSDEMEGRAPGSKGEELATAYVGDYFKSIGLKTQMQPVPLLGLTPTVSSLKLTGMKAATLKYGDEFMAWTQLQKDSVAIGGDLVFAGYGVVAPEFDWNDFKDSVKGKIIVVLVNDPQLDDPKMFGGKAMTYYGRWT